MAVIHINQVEFLFQILLKFSFFHDSEKNYLRKFDKIVSEIAETAILFSNFSGDRFVQQPPGNASSYSTPKS